MISDFKNLQVLYEDNHIIAVNKRAGDIVQGDKTGDKPLSEIVKEYLKDKYKKEGNVYLGVPHRLDRPTTGIVVFAKTSKVLPRLNKMFSEKDEIQKKYWAIVEKRKKIPESETLIHWLVRNESKNISKAFDNQVNESKKAELKYNILKELDNFYLVEIQLLTGRHHQIRCQFSKIGLPIKGDIKYGAKRTNKDASINLHAREISFIHPVKKEKITIIAEVPQTDNIWAFS